MKKKFVHFFKKIEHRNALFFVFGLFFVLFFILFLIAFLANIKDFNEGTFSIQNNNPVLVEEKKEVPKYPELNKTEYDERIHSLANNPLVEVIKKDEVSGEEKKYIEEKKTFWPIDNLPYPKDGAILPFKRIVAYYGNLYSKKMGVLGEYEEEEMLAKLAQEVENWQISDLETPVVPALHYIAVVAQAKPGKDGKYRLVMPDSQIDKVLEMAKKINALVFLDIQVGQSSIYEELPKFEKYLKMPNVHLAIDPEFYMRENKVPGKYMGTIDAKEINYATDFLARIVNEENLYPKILIIHRFTQKMVTNYKDIKIIPEVQFVMNMDGWGGKPHKLSTYKSFIHKEPVHFAGFKIFYKNDIKEKGSVLISPKELLDLNPKPIYIQYQ